MATSCNCCSNLARVRNPNSVLRMLQLPQGSAKRPPSHSTFGDGSVAGVVWQSALACAERHHSTAPFLSVGFSIWLHRHQRRVHYAREPLQCGDCIFLAASLPLAVARVQWRACGGGVQSRACAHVFVKGSSIWDSHRLA